MSQREHYLEEELFEANAKIATLEQKLGECRADLAALRDALAVSRRTTEIALGALADIANSRDMMISIARAKAKRVYEELTQKETP